MVTVAEQFAETVAATGVKADIRHRWRQPERADRRASPPGKIEWLHVRHEEVAAFAAGAEAHLTGEPAVPLKWRNITGQTARRNRGAGRREVQLSDRNAHAAGAENRRGRDLAGATTLALREIAATVVRAAAAMSPKAPGLSRCGVLPTPRLESRRRVLQWRGPFLLCSFIGEQAL
jgi:hypothetical protein